jgi:N-acetylmuramoyl-L-alanine amidase
MRRGFVFWMLAVAVIFQVQAQSADHVAAVARPGEGIYSLLRLYNLNTPCNLSYFLKINAISEKTGLKVNKAYLLPIYVYAYNGKSIRSTIGIDDLERAKRIQAFNESMEAAGLQNGDYRKTLVLWVPHSEINCPGEMLPAPEAQSAVLAEPENPGIRGTYDIFGDKYAEVPAKDESLKGCVYYIVSGHGGPDPGAIGTRAGNSLCEDEYAYDVALRLARNLLMHGATPYVIIRDLDGIRDIEFLPCDKDETCWKNQKIPHAQKKRLEQRVEIVNELFEKNEAGGVKYQRLITIHVDSDASSERVDMFFYCNPGSNTGENLCNTLKETIREKYEKVQSGRGYNGSVSARDLYLLRESKMPAVFLELGNIKNTSDQLRLILPANRQYIADWLAEGFIRDVEDKK